VSQSFPKPLRILFVAPYLPSAIRVRPFQLIRHLARAGHRITVVALDDRSPADSSALAELQAICDDVHLIPHTRLQAASQAILALPTSTPLWAAFCQSSPMMRLLRSLAQSKKFDVAHIEHLRAAHFAAALGNLPCVFDAVDCITDLQQQIVAQTRLTNPRHWLAWEESVKLRRYEPQIYNGFSQIAVTSSHDADALTALHVRTPITVIPNGVDLKMMPLSTDKDQATKRFDLIFSGKMSYQANEDAALFLLEEILPRLDAQLLDMPPVTVCIVGAGPGDRLRRAASRWEERVTITGWVEKIQPFLAASRIAVCPMRIGVGIQNKALEAMAMGLPVVATPLAGRALTANTQNEGLRLATDAETFAHYCACWLQDDLAAKRAGQVALGYVRQFHRWETAVTAFTQLYRNVLAE
jgi:glycosyltransferase involved in cell wall biosynthesis